MTIKELIVKTVNDHQGIKATELAVDVISENTEITPDDYENALSELIRNGEIVEVEYTLPSMDYRVKSWFLPKDSVVVVSKAS